MERLPDSELRPQGVAVVILESREWGGLQGFPCPKVRLGMRNRWQGEAADQCRE
jgi:hypothetical protein